jgi:hypothetical protein
MAIAEEESTVRVACVQASSIHCDTEANKIKFTKLCRKSAEHGKCLELLFFFTKMFCFFFHHLLALLFQFIFNVVPKHVGNLVTKIFLEILVFFEQKRNLSRGVLLGILDTL